MHLIPTPKILRETKDIIYNKTIAFDYVGIEERLTKAIQKLGKLEDIHNGLLQKRREKHDNF